MKFRNFIIVLLAVLMAFAFASCKHEPKVDPKPTPQPKGDIYQIEVTEGVDKDYYSRDKIKLVWPVSVAEGDVISLKYRSERAVYQWDIRNDSHKWVYETDKNGFVDPVLGEDGWYTMTYTIGKTITGAAGASSALGIYFRGNFVTTDIFEIKDIMLNDEELEVEQSNITSQAKLNDPAEDFDWSVKNYAVLFATGKPGAVDKTPIAEKVVAGGKVTGAPISKDGYRLTIYTDEAHTAIFDPTQPINEEKIFYYEYVGLPQTVTFVTNVEATIDPATVPYGDTLLAAHTYDEAGNYALDGEGAKVIVNLVPANPSKEGFAFAAWCSDEGLTTDFDFATPITGATTLYAKYGTPRTVTFDAQNGEAEHATAVVADGYPVAMPEAPENGTYLFTGWFTDAECTTAYNFSAAVEADITLYAGWVSAVDVTLDLNYTDAPAATVYKAPYGQALDEDDENLVPATRELYVFAGWYTDAGCTTAYNYDTVLTANFTLYAKWTESTLYRLVAKNNGSDSLYDYDKIGIKFKDYTYKDAEENEITVTYRKVNDNDVLSFRYRTSRDFKGFSIRGDKKWIYQNTDAENNYGLTSFEVKEDGWTYVTYKFDSSTGYDTTASQATNAWFEIHFFNRYDDPKGSGGIMKGDILEIQDFRINGEPMEIDENSVSGYAGATLSIVEGGAYAWTAHAVTFNTNEGSAIANAEVAYGKYVEKPADPTKEGSVFFDWYADAELTTKFNFNTPIVEDTTIYAKWVAPVTLTFNSQDGSAVDAIQSGAGLPIAKPADPTKAGYLFNGWFEEAECTTPFDFTKGIAADKTVYAKWITPMSLTYSLNYLGAPESQVALVEAGTAITEPQNPSRAGYFFGGWYKEAECTNAFVFADGIAADTTVYAKWNEPTETYTLTATAEADRFQFRFKKSSFAFLDKFKAGDVFTFLVKFTPVDGSSTITRFRVRGASSYGGTSDFSSGVTTTDAGSGWIAVTCVFPEDADFSENGILMDIRKAAGNFAVGDIIDIKAVAFNGQEIAMTSSSSSGPYEGVAPSFAKN